MAENFNIKSKAEWEGVVRSLKDAKESMDYALDLMKDQVNDYLLQYGVSGDVVPVLMDAYEKDVLATYRQFGAGVEAFIKTNEMVNSDIRDVDDRLNTRIKEVDDNKKVRKEII